MRFDASSRLKCLVLVSVADIKKHICLYSCTLRILFEVRSGQSLLENLLLLRGQFLESSELPPRPSPPFLNPIIFVIMIVITLFIIVRCALFESETLDSI